MITESRTRKMNKFIQMNCLEAMEDFPIDMAKAFIYMFESRGFKLGSIDNQDFVDYFREKRSFSDKDESKWFDGNNAITPEWDNVKYKNIKSERVRLRMKVTGAKLRVDDLSFGFQSIGKIKPINLNRSIKEAIGELVDIFVEIADIVVENEKKGIRRWDLDVKKQLKDKYKPEQEQSFKKKLQPIKQYFEKLNYEFKIDKSYDVYHISIKPLELQNIEFAHRGMYYPHQYLEYSKKLPFIVKRFNQIGLWLTKYGSNSEDGAWLEFNALAPERTSSQHYGRDSETGETRSRKTRDDKENLKYLTVREQQQEYVNRVTKWTQEMSQSQDVHERYYETIKNLFIEMQEGR